jgi:cytochrome c-type biogenesis protein CcmH/NrfG
LRAAGGVLSGDAKADEAAIQVERLAVLALVAVALAVAVDVTVSVPTWEGLETSEPAPMVKKDKQEGFPNDKQNATTASTGTILSRFDAK